ncbi:MAG: SUMF1/EgtB/PvdO family nonheme iron enzyme [Bacteroidota bacterium]
MAEEETRDITEGIPEHFKPSLKRNNHLFCIGINDYKHVSKLNNAVKDVEDFAALLQKEYNFQKKHTHILKDKQATRRKITNRLKSYASSLTEKDNLLLYFSGHGIKDKLTKEGFWIPVEGEKEEEDSWLANETVIRYIRSMKAHHVFLLIDACFAGSFFVKARSTAIKYDQAPSRFAITSGAEEIVSDGPDGENSPFARCKLNYLKNHQTSVVGAEGMFEEIKKHISAGQRPQGRHLEIGGKLFDGEFYFYRKINTEKKDIAVNQQARKTEVIAKNSQSYNQKSNPVKTNKEEEPLFNTFDIDLIQNLTKGQRLAGTVSEIFGSGVSVDIGGINGLIHISDLTWKSISHPNEILKLGDVVEAVVLDFVNDKVKIKKHIRLGIKQLILKEEASIQSKETSIQDKLNIEMVKVEGGSFMMGRENGKSEMPVHVVKLKDYFIGKYPVTQYQWEQVMGEIPLAFKGTPQQPMGNLAWKVCKLFINKLNEETGMQFRLPTEAEWEYAARGGKFSKGYLYAGSNSLGEVGWFCNNSGDEPMTFRDVPSHYIREALTKNNGRLRPVGQKKPNELGLYDFSGNIFEWCEDDWFNSYKEAPDVGIARVNQPRRSKKRVLRGGAWDLTEKACTVTRRYAGWLNTRESTYGFRLCCDAM